MKIRFLMHSLYGSGGGVLTVVHNLAAALTTRHEVELVGVVRGRDEPVHPFPSDVEVRSLVDARGRGKGERTTGPGREPLREPSRLMPSREPHYGTYSRASDLALEEYLGGIDDGAVIGMQPGVNLAIARLAPTTVLRLGQDHRPTQDRRGDLRRAYKAHLPHLDAFLTLTERDAVRWRRILGPALRIEAMPNGTPSYDGAASALTEKVVVAAGQLKRNKGFDRLIDAWSHVVQAHPDWRLRIFGMGPLHSQLEEQIQRLGLASSVRLMGYSHQLQVEMAASSMFVLSSRAEGFGMVLVEAMSCGLPVVSFDCPAGPRSIIDSGVDGFLVPNGDIDGLAERIIQLIDIGPEGRRGYGDAALQSARRSSQPVIASRWEHLLDELAATRAAQAVSQ